MYRITLGNKAHDFTYYEDAKRYADDIFTRTGVIVGIEFLAEAHEYWDEEAGYAAACTCPVGVNHTYAGSAHE